MEPDSESNPVDPDLTSSLNSTSLNEENDSKAYSHLLIGTTVVYFILIFAFTAVAVKVKEMHTKA
jgi:hypothetical protein